MRHYKQWCLNNGVPTFQAAMQEAMDKLTGFGEPLGDVKTSRRQDAKTPQGSGSSGGLERSSKNDQTTTTTTTTVTPRRQDARRENEPTLPLGPVGVVNGSKLSLARISAYAWAMHMQDGSVKWPDRFAASALQTGKYDEFVLRWEEEQLRPTLPPLRPCRKCKVAFRPKTPEASGVYCSPECNY